MVWLVIALMGLVTIVLSSQTEQLLVIAKEYRNEYRIVAQKDVNSLVYQYFKETGDYPVSLKALSEVEGYSVAKKYLPRNQGGFLEGEASTVYLAVAPTPLSGDPLLNDGAWQYKRIAVFSLKDRLETPANFLSSANNSCGAGEYKQSISWCGKASLAEWSRHETKESGVPKIREIKESQIRTLAKFVAYYNTVKNFPDPGTNTTLASLVGSPTLATCSGGYQWQGIPFDCEDLFNKYGKPVAIFRASGSDLILYSETTLLDNLGETIVIGSSLNL